MSPAKIDSGQPLLIPPVPKSLPSQVARTFNECPRFRIILIGNSGVGKSSLVRHMFNVDPAKIDIAHNRAGEADIEEAYESSDNPRFILHDSKGFEAGSKTNWDKVERFLRRSQAYSELSRRIHAIWFCLETPRRGGRLLQSGDEDLLKLSIELNIPMIAVFTKYDSLVNQYLSKDRSKRPMPEKLADSEKKASASLISSVGMLQDAWKGLLSSGAQIPWVKISTSTKDTDPVVMRKMLVELANVTRQTLRGVEGELWIPWAAAQQVNARQKVELSVFEGAKKYWIDLGKSIVFEGEMIIDCIRRIHDDILLVWNFNDPDKILSSPEFFSRMIALVAPPADDLLNQTSSLADGVSTVSDLISLVQAAGATALALPLSAISLGVLALRFLYGKYQKYPSTAKFLATYIVNLVVILHGIFLDILPSDPPRPLSSSVVIDALECRKSSLQTNAFDDINFGSGVVITPERISQAIYTCLGIDITGCDPIS